MTEQTGPSHSLVFVWGIIATVLVLVVALTVGVLWWDGLIGAQVHGTFVPAVKQVGGH